MCLCSHPISLRTARPEGKAKSLMVAISNIDHAMMEAGDAASHAGQRRPQTPHVRRAPGSPEANPRTRGRHAPRQRQGIQRAIRRNRQGPRAGRRAHPHPCPHRGDPSRAPLPPGRSAAVSQPALPMTSRPENDWLAAARAAMEIEADSIRCAASRLDGELIRAVELILAHPGEVIVTGIGKSGHIARKIVATLCSTGTAAVFLHPAEAVHGDLGIYTPGDPTVLLSHRGTSAELQALVPLLRQFRSPLIGILGNLGSPLAARMDVLLDASVEREADPHNLAPTASAAAAMAVGHALAIALMRARDFTPQEFGRFHPGGQLGRNLRLSVAEAMHTGDEVATVAPETSFQAVILAMTERPMRSEERRVGKECRARWAPD